MATAYELELENELEQELQDLLESELGSMPGWKAKVFLAP